MAHRPPCQDIISFHCWLFSPKTVLGNSTTKLPTTKSAQQGFLRSLILASMRCPRPFSMYIRQASYPPPGGDVFLLVFALLYRSFSPMFSISCVGRLFRVVSSRLSHWMQVHSCSFVFLLTDALFHYPFCRLLFWMFY
ncbi:hypothetical protein GALMADRAFT_787175 [Galerina marginata CBS 339.88]|uniref:Uncharacterized protein n=1 Tax=Galerina marginata (strain CBS 339.88) TaxID=685588 RepID=A0A067SNA0_GALM3|nr:hypothetical protein GALMADRAFT_787175 [Galerina marginata CBS 339.88]